MVCDKKERQAQGISVMWVKIGQSITNNFYKYTSYNGHILAEGSTDDPD